MPNRNLETRNNGAGDERNGAYAAGEEGIGLVLVAVMGKDGVMVDAAAVDAVLDTLAES